MPLILRHARLCLLVSVVKQQNGWPASKSLRPIRRYGSPRGYSRRQVQGRLRTRSAWIGSGETSELIRCMIRSTIRSLSWGDTSCSERFRSRAGTRKCPKVLQYIHVLVGRNIISWTIYGNIVVIRWGGGGGLVASWLGSYVGGIRQWFVPLQKKKSSIYGLNGVLDSAVC